MAKNRARAHLKNLEKPTGKLVWEKDIVNDMAAFSSNSVLEGEVILGDFSKSVIGIYGSGCELVIDPFTQAKKGLIIITAILLADSCVQNKKGFSILTDASIAV